MRVLSIRRSFWFLCIWFFVFFPLSPVYRPPLIHSTTGPVMITKPSKNEVVIAAVGDIMMPLSLQAAAERSSRQYDLLFERIAKDLSTADISIANLETPIDHLKPVSGYPRFNSRPALLTALKKSGIKLVSMANNHVMDAGTEGLIRTIDNLEASGMVYTGVGRTKAEAGEIKFLQARGLNAAFLSYTYDTNERRPRTAAHLPGVNVIRNESDSDLKQACQSVQRARLNSDVVVVSLHWGEEYAKDPTPWQRRAATQLVHAGADVILGHHPHVLQPIESIQTRDGRVGLVAFSLGNFVSSQNAGISLRNKDHRNALTGDGIILYITVVKQGGRVRVAHADYLPIWTHWDRSGTGRTCRPVSLNREIANIGSLVSRTREQDDSLKLLAYRKTVIEDTLGVKP